MSTDIPNEMKTLVVTSPGDGKGVSSATIEVQTVPTPTPRSGEVLVKVHAAPVNPSDYGAWFKSKESDYPLRIGKEGSGVVVATGGGLTTYRCPVGTHVGFVFQDTKQGSYSEFVTVNALTGVFPMPNNVPIEDCCSFFVNPYTAVAILDTAQGTAAAEGKQYKSIVHTAAASQLGQMIVKLAPSKNIEVINVVRREEQKELLEGLGAKHVVVTSGDEIKWKAELKSKISELNCACAFDAVSGKSTGDLFSLLPSKGSLFLYGGLAGDASNINPMDLIYRKKQLKGWLLSDWLTGNGSISMVGKLLAAGKVVNEGLKDGGWSSSQFQDTTLEKVQEDVIKLLEGSATSRKLRVRFVADAVVAAAAETSSVVADAVVAADVDAVVAADADASVDAVVAGDASADAVVAAD